MIFDIVVLSVLFVSCVIAFLRGFIREVLIVIGVVGGAAAAYYLGPHLSPVVRGWFGVADVNGKEEVPKYFDIVPVTAVADLVAYGAIFVIVFIMLSVISHFLSGGAKALGLGPLDRTLGVVFGLLRGVLFLALLYLPLYVFFEKKERDEWPWLKDSRTRVYVEGLAAWMDKFLPESAKKDIQEGAENAEKATREKLQEMDILRPDQPAEEVPEEPLPPLPEGIPLEPVYPGEEPVYPDEDRGGMQDLIRDKGGFNE